MLFNIIYVNAAILSLVNLRGDLTSYNLNAIKGRPLKFKKIFPPCFCIAYYAIANSPGSKALPLLPESGSFSVNPSLDSPAPLLSFSYGYLLRCCMHVVLTDEKWAAENDLEQIRKMVIGYI